MTVYFNRLSDLCKAFKRYLDRGLGSTVYEIVSRPKGRVQEGRNNLIAEHSCFSGSSST